jgi:hypothetical protein
MGCEKSSSKVSINLPLLHWQMGQNSEIIMGTFKANHHGMGRIARIITQLNNH